jgi:hypothetical protein
VAAAGSVLIDEFAMNASGRLSAPRILVEYSSPCVRTALLRKCLNGWLWLAVIGSLQVAQPANAEGPDRWRPYPGVGVLESVSLRIHWFNSTDELRDAAETSGQPINEIGLHGFSILKRNTETGEYVCDLYVVKMTGALIDGDRTTTFGHEVLHCFGLRHE